MNYEMVKNNYEKGLWNIQLVKIAVAKGIITREDYKTITGIEYPNIK